MVQSDALDLDLGDREIGGLSLLRALRWIAIAGTGVAVAAAAAHLLELPNKLRLDGPLWLAVQQQLYRGWGPVLGPFEVAGLLATCALAAYSYKRHVVFAFAFGAAVCLAIAHATFWLVVQPVNEAFAQWTPATLPGDWTAHRLRWETGHAFRFLFLLAALVALIRRVPAHVARPAASAAAPAIPISRHPRARIRARD